ncbi:ATP-grasp domain-containing protein [Streptomyces sp. NPDC001890]|uniref:ATP-binding protein n=1 Tax=Streptomyces sp. NPDC001890 TaxID=3364620 RepID=UPI0036B0C773
MERQSKPKKQEEGVLLIVGCRNEMREFVLQQASAAYPLWLVSGEEPTWQEGYLQGWTKADLSDPTDPAALLAAVDELSAEMTIGGVLCFEEGLIMLAAAVTGHLGLPGLTTETAWKCRDKGATRAVMASAGVPQPQSVAVVTCEEALRAASDIGYPVVVKPRALGGALGVRVVHDPAALEQSFAAVESAIALCQDEIPVLAEPVLVETYLDGPDVSVESISHLGRTHPLVVARVSTVCAPYFEEADHVMDGADPLLDDAEFRRMLQDAHTALGITEGATLTQWRLTRSGPQLVEVNGRLGGDLVPFLGGRVTGTAPALAAADVAMGHAPATDRRPQGAAVITFVFPPYDLRVGSLAVEGPLPDGVHVGLLAAEGDELRLPPRDYKNRLAYITAEADDADACLRLVDEAKKLIKLEGEPLQ